LLQRSGGLKPSRTATERKQRAIHARHYTRSGRSEPCEGGDHFHLLLEPNLFPLSRMMQQLNSSYSQSFNRRQERVGHVLQGRFKSPMIDGDDYFRRVRSFDADPSVAQRRYVAFVAGGPPGRTDRLPGSVADGPEPFPSHLGRILEAHRDEAEVTYAERFACRPHSIESSNVPTMLQRSIRACVRPSSVTAAQCVKSATSSGVRRTRYGGAFVVLMGRPTDVACGKRENPDLTPIGGCSRSAVGHLRG
jgi:hypothetical protein